MRLSQKRTWRRGRSEFFIVSRFLNGANKCFVLTCFHIKLRVMCCSLAFQFNRISLPLYTHNMV